MLVRWHSPIRSFQSAGPTTTTTSPLPLARCSPPATAKQPAAAVARRPVASPGLAVAGSPAAHSSMAAKWAQKTVVIPAQHRGCHLITPKILREIEGDLSGFKCGLAHLFLQHTSASLTINENYDSDVQADTETFLNRIVPEGRSAPWKHTLEGPDDMPAHIKSSMFGCALTIPITDGHLNMGTWQGIWLCEHRDNASSRKIVITLNGV
uniref:Secondary thiamine-phosphate synthase enzyme n=3 Tax=Oryza TaxID=4527 RepID=A0A0D3F1R0_9ORYZ